MKLFKNGVMYVEVEAIRYVRIVPSDVAKVLVDESLEDGSVIEFTSKTTVFYWLRRKDILDYKTLRHLTDDQLQRKVKIWCERLIFLTSQQSMNKKRLDEVKIHKISYMIETVQRYLNHRETIDNKFERLA